MVSSSSVGKKRLDLEKRRRRTHNSNLQDTTNDIHVSEGTQAYQKVEGFSYFLVVTHSTISVNRALMPNRLRCAADLLQWDNTSCRGKADAPLCVSFLLRAEELLLLNDPNSN